MTFSFESILAEYDAYRIGDDILSEAYDNVTAEQRSILKTAQAMTEAVFGETRLPKTVITSCEDTGLCITVTKRAVPWTVCVIGSRADPVLLCSVLSVARFTHADNIAVVFSDLPTQKACFTALDLCGIEDAFSLPESELQKLLRQLSEQTTGRLITVAAGGVWAETAYRLHVPFYNADTAKLAQITGDSFPENCAVPIDLTPEFFIETDIAIKPVETASDSENTARNI